MTHSQQHPPDWLSCAGPGEILGVSANVVYAVLNLLINLLRGLDKRLLDVVGGSGGGFEEEQPIFLSKFGSLLRSNLAPVLQIALVTNEHDGHVLVAVLTRLLEPTAQVVE